MKLLIATFTSLIFGLAACKQSDKKAEKTKDKYEQTKESMGETEMKNPTRFITVNSHDKRNLIGQTVIKGTITNNATVAIFKDVDIELSFFSKTGALLEKDHEVIYETLYPGSNTDFKSKYFAPKGTDSIALKVKGAKDGTK